MDGYNEDGDMGEGSCLGVSIHTGVIYKEHIQMCVGVGVVTVRCGGVRRAWGNHRFVYALYMHM